MTDSLFETTLGIVGGGQLGRMLGEAASPLGVETVVLDPTPSCPAFPPAVDQIEADFDETATDLDPLKPAIAAIRRRIAAVVSDVEAELARERPLERGHDFV